MKNLVIIGPINPFDSKISGTRNYVMNFLNSLSPNETAILYGHTTLKNSNRNTIKNNIIFYPLVVYPEKKERYYIPQTFKFIFKLYRYKNAILSKGNVLHIQRIDHTIPFLFPQKKGKIVLYFHGAASKGYLTGIGFKSKFKGIIYLMLEHLILPKVDKIITVSRKDERFYTTKYPYVSKKITTIPIPLDLNLFKVRNDKKTLCKKYGLDDRHKIILYAGRFSKVKGIDLIIKAFVNLNRVIPNTYLILVGKGEDERRLRKLISDLKATNIKFMGSLAHDEMPYILNCADVLVMASLTEGLPTIVLEALACGLPVVSTDVGDISSVIKNEKIGYLIEERNEDDLKDNLIRALVVSGKNKEERKEIAEKYSADSLSDRILQVHKKLFFS
ncbi:MAG: glycosyltransferase family 4 protein [Methanomassiliicoccales archaeon]|nr:MAG: glycosyltransferase family 4 protein [Methanomassiliicoccales archaeon]